MAKRKRTESSGGGRALTVKKAARKRVRVASGSWLSKKAVRVSSTYDIAGITRDGVTILRAKVKPKHFTSKQIRKAINQVERPLSAKA